MLNRHTLSVLLVIAAAMSCTNCGGEDADAGFVAGADDDGDGLTNGRERELGTSIKEADTDKDGQSDFVESWGGAEPPPDRDTDGKHDALESDLTDVDKDCISDERDPDDANAEIDASVIGELACCCTGACAEVGASATATCTLGADGTPVLSCVVQGPVEEQYPCVPDCDANDDCQGGSVCDQGRCIIECTTDPVVCGSASYCDGRRCRPERADGARCTEDRHCASGVCDGEVCVKSCADDPNVCVDQYCDGRICKDLVADGGPCTSNAMCASDECHEGRCRGPCGREGCPAGSWCDGLECKPQIDNGSPCDESRQCRSGLCADARCEACEGARPCDDADPCTHSDICDGGACRGTTVTCENDASLCGARRDCNGTATCTLSWAPTTIACDDGDLCTHTDRCDGAGECAGQRLVCENGAPPCGALRTCNGSPQCDEDWPDASVTCDDSVICTYDDRCDGAGGCGGTTITCTDEPGPCGARRDCNGSGVCTISYADEATSCDDGDPCTYTDHCDGSGGCGGTTVVCDSDSGECGAARACNGTATCTVVYPDETTSCDDESVCTAGDACDGAGNCVGEGQPCVGDPGTCGVDRVCDAMLGCVESFPTSTTVCDDGQGCTHTDRCDGAGACTGITITCANDPGTCGAKRTCNGTNTCTTTFPDITIPCDDGSACTFDDTCDEQGGCAGTTILCEDDPSTCGPRRECNGTNTCTVSTPGSDITCDDGDACTFDDRCSGSGACAGTPLTCTSDIGPCGAVRTCNGTSQCSVAYANENTTCDDGQACTHTDRCDGAGQCNGMAVTCDDDPGTCGANRACDGDATCNVGYPDAATTCDDGNACTFGDKCNGAGGCGGTGVTCVSDPGPCGAVRTCNGSGTCTVTYAGQATTCDDGNACTYNDRCDGSGGCGGTTLTCTSDLGTCGAQRTCNGTSQCTVTMPNNSVTCDDGIACTYNDRCNGSGVCGGTGITCNNDAGTCGAKRSCNGTSQCTVTLPGQTTTCDDGVACTHTDRCNGAGGCAGTTISCPSDPGPCGLVRACNGTATCSASYPGPATACNDGNACTYSDVCNGGGGCGGSPISCPTDGSCGPQYACNGTSQCSVSYPGSGRACSDGNNCTVGDVCNGGGGCASGGAPAAGTQCGDTRIQVCCGTSCVNLAISNQHCGGCNQGCSGANTCLGTGFFSSCPAPNCPNRSGRCSCSNSTQCPDNQSCTPIAQPGGGYCSPDAQGECAPGQTYYPVANCPDFCSYFSGYNNSNCSQP